jgi:hypothetical protein
MLEAMGRTLWRAPAMISYEGLEKGVSFRIWISNNFSFFFFPFRTLYLDKSWHSRFFLVHSSAVSCFQVRTFSTIKLVVSIYLVLPMTLDLT